MQPAPSTSLAPPSIPAMRQLSEKPRQGFETRKTARKPGPSSCNFKVTLGLRATVVGNGVRETYSARYYNPATGRFLSRDPLDGDPMDPKGLHKYLYANGDPVDSIDPTGQGAIGEFIVNVWRNSITQTVVYAARLICWEVKWISWSIIGISHALGKPVTPFPWWMTWGCTAISGFGPPAIPSF